MGLKAKLQNQNESVVLKALPLTEEFFRIESLTSGTHAIGRLTEEKSPATKARLF
jgi:hypothetical protein